MATRSTPKRHHCVPDLYLSSFTDRSGSWEGQLYAYDLQQGQSFLTAVENAAVIGHHRYQVPDGTPVSAEGWLAAVEDAAKAPLDRLLAGDICDALEAAERRALARLLATLRHRTPGTRQSMHDMVDQMVAVVGPRVGKDLVTPLARWMAGFWPAGVDATAVRTITAETDHAAAALLALRWQLWHDPASSLIIGDNPLILTDGEMLMLLMPRSHSVRFWVPLSPRLVLAGYEPGTGTSTEAIRSLTLADAMHLNYLQAEHAECFLYAHSHAGMSGSWATQRTRRSRVRIWTWSVLCRLRQTNAECC